MPPGLAYLLAPRLEPGSRAYTGGPFLPTKPALRLELIALLKLAKDYDKSLEEEEKMTAEQLEIKNVGKVDPKRHLEEKVDVLMTNNVVQCIGAMLDTIVFK